MPTLHLSAVINELVEEKDIDRAELRSIVCEGILSAYEKKFPEVPLRAQYIEKTGEIVVEAQKEVVNTVEDEDIQISLRKARLVNTQVQIGDKVWLSFEGAIGRIEIMRAKQIIATRIRKIEWAAIYEEFKPREGAIIQGTVHKLERSGISIKVQDARIPDTLAFLPRSLAIEGEKLVPGYPIRALLKEVLPEPRGDNQLILDRSSEQFVARLFEREFPEVFERIVEVRRVVRLPGYKSKVAVFSGDKNIDPVGTCIGVGGARIRPLLKELNGEKIDVIAWSDNLEHFVRGALKPAEINRVEIVEGEGARVWLDDEQRAVAIGRMGQNIALAARLVGIPIRLMESGGNAPRPFKEVAEDEEFGSE